MKKNWISLQDSYNGLLACKNLRTLALFINCVLANVFLFCVDSLVWFGFLYLYLKSQDFDWFYLGFGLEVWCLGKFQWLESVIRNGDFSSFGLTAFF